MKSNNKISLGVKTRVLIEKTIGMTWFEAVSMSMNTTDSFMENMNL